MRKTMSTLILGLALVATACGAAAGQAGSVTAAPTTPFTLFDGTTATLADYQGQPVVVNFWASWCPSCVAEMSAAFKPAQERIGNDVAFLGINIQDERDKALRLIDETGVQFDLAEDPDGRLYVDLKGLGMPFTVFIDSAGSIIHEHNGPLTEQQLVDLIEEHLLS
jgi:thiol-disulfide isomerase/thioredoxin